MTSVVAFRGAIVAAMWRQQVLMRPCSLLRLKIRGEALQLLKAVCVALGNSVWTSRPAPLKSNIYRYIRVPRSSRPSRNYSLGEFLYPSFGTVRSILTEVMMSRVEMRDIADVTANILDAEKRALAASQAEFQADFEAHEAKFNADLEALRAQTSKVPAKLEPAASWLLARKCWAWLRRD